MAHIICDVHGDKHRTAQTTAVIVQVIETREQLYMKRAKCECGTYIWYEGNTTWGMKYFYGDPQYIDSFVDGGNRTIFLINESKISSGIPIDWEF